MKTNPIIKNFLTRAAMTLGERMTRSFTVMLLMLMTAATAWAGQKPITNLDVCRGEAYSIYVRGWAFDPDARDWGLDVKVYVYTDAACQNEYTYKKLATGDARSDVVAAHSLPNGSKPGFEGRIPITDPGTYYVKVYAIDIDQWGDNVANSSTEMSHSFNPVTVTTLTTIGSAAEWNIFVNAIKTGAEDFTGKTVKLTADIPTAAEIAAGTTAVTTITSEEKAFCGTFDGQGHTINVDLNVSGNEAAGLFSYVKGATIKNLTVTGTINNTGLYVGGLVGTAKGATIKNCTFAATINSSGDEVGAFVGGCNQIDANTPGNLTLQDCVFSGSIHYTGSFSCKTAGLVNVWNNTSLNIRNCLVSGSFTSERSGSQFYPIAFKEANATVTANVSNTYYLNTLPATLFGSNVASGAEGIAVTTTTTEKYDRTVVAIDGNTYYAVSPSYILTNGISSTEDWVDFAALVNQGIESFDGQTVKLMSDVSLSTMVGLSGHPFRGSFDGQSHTLNVSISNGSGASAPFASINGATIKGLTVTGSVSGGNHSSGLVGACGADRPNTISYCTINTNVSGAAYLGGIVGHGGDGTLTIQDCVYDGTISGFIGYAGGLLGWCGSLTLTIDNCLFKGTMTPASGGKFHPIACKNGGSTVISTVSKALYLNTVTPTATGNVLIPDAKGIPVNTSFVEGQWHNPVLAADYNIYYSAKHVGVISEIKIVGEGKTAEDYEDFESALPLEAYVPYSISEQIYTADEFGMAGAIRSIGFYSYRAEGTRNIDIYMVSTTLSSFNNGQIYNFDEICNIVNVTDIVNISVADKVFSGNVSFVKDGWTDIELDKLFEYDGVNNVLLVVNDKTGRETGEDISYFSVYKTSKHQSACSIDLNASFDPMNMSGIPLNFTIKNHLRIVKEEDSPVPTPGKIHADEMTPYSAKLSWEVKGNSATYKLRYKTVNANSWTTITGVTSPYTLTGLTEATDYEVQMQAAYEAGISEWSESVYFSTQANNSAPYSLNISDVTSFSATLNWRGWHDSYNVRYRTSMIEYIKEDFEGFMSGFTNTGILAQNTDGTNQFIALGYESTETQYLISSQLDEVKSGSIVAFYQRYFFNANTFRIGYSSTTNQVDAFTWGDAHEAASSFTIYYEYIPDGTKFIAIQVQADNQGEAIFIENFNVFYPNGRWVTVTTNNPPLAITGLTPGIKYDWQVQGNKTGVGTTDWSEVAVFTTTPLPDITLADDGTNNVATIAAYNDKAVNVTLSGRTLYRDGDWNTLTLPFSISDLTGTPLEGATVKTLGSSAFSNGTLTLNFEDATSIEAGKPYIVKWDEALNLTINSTAEWNAFAESVNGGKSYAGKTVLLGADIDVSTMVGTAEHPFSGTFEGAGHTLNVSISGGEGAAPFHYINGATIRNVKTTGTVSGGNHSAGLVGVAQGGTNSIRDCYVAATVSTSGSYVGGILGNGTTSTTTISNCLFGGYIAASYMGILYGWGEVGGTHKVENCVAHGTYALGGSIDLLLGNGTKTVTNCWKNTDLGSQGDNSTYIYTGGTHPLVSGYLGSQWTYDNGFVLSPTVSVVDENIVNPVFTGVTIPSGYTSSEAINAALATASCSTDYVDFIGTYSPQPLYESTDAKHYLYLGADNTLYYPSAEGFHVNAFRAWFQLKNGLTAGEPKPGSPNGVRAFVLNFGDETTSLSEEIRVKSEEFATAAEWYTLDGRRLNGKPTRKGLYIHNGKKVVIK